MLIISKFRDYYDNVGHTTGIDKSIVYERHYEKIKDYMALATPKQFGGLWYPGVTGRGIWKRNRWVLPEGPSVKEAEYFIVGFAGKLYVGVKKLVSNLGWMVEDRTEYEYGSDLLKTLEDNLSKEKHQRKNQMVILDFVKKYHGSDEYTHLFFAVDSPIFMQKINTRTANSLHINPELGKMWFYKEKDAFSAFQDLQGFISGVLGTDRKKQPETDDKYKILAAGFDLKTSFRKDKES